MVFAEVKVPQSVSLDNKLSAAVPETVTFDNPPPSPLKSAAFMTLVISAFAKAMVPYAFADTIVPACAGNVSVTSAVDAGPCNVTALVPLSLSSKNLIKPALVAPFLISAPLFITGVVKVGVVKVLLVKVSVVALPTRVSVAEGKVKVTSAVDAGPIRVTALVPLSLSS